MAKSIQSFSTVLGLTVAGLLVACGAATPTKELMDARAAYQQASQGRAAELTPDKLLSAKQALDRAEIAHEEDAGSYQERSLAYVAQRMSELAAAYAGQADAQRSAENAERAYVEAQEELRKEAQGGLRESQERLDKASRDLAAQGSKLKEQEAALAAERAARADAEKKLAALNAKMDQRGMVITLQGAVLFTSGKAVLLPLAQTKLSEVAEVLKQQPPEKHIVVEGHTDSVGSDSTNLSLSQSRADAVRVHLVSRGVKSDRITAIGKGESVPIADNKSAEGRANNRRVEIVIN